MRPEIKRELKQVFDLSKEGMPPIVPLPGGLRPVFQADDGSIYAYDKKRDSIRIIGKTETLLSMQEFDELVFEVFHARGQCK